MFEFLQLTRMCTHSFVRSFAHLFDHPKCVLYYARACVRQFILSHVYYRQLYSLIGPCPGFLLPCFLLCISNYEGEFLGTTRIAWFCLISSLNRDILQVQPSPPFTPRRVHSIPLRSDRSTLFSFFIYFSRAIFWRETIKYIKFVFHIVWKILCEILS